MSGTSIFQAVEAFVALLVVLAFVALLTRRVGLPYTVALVLFGVAISTVSPPVHLQVSPELVLVVLLPGLVFEAAYSLDERELIRALAGVLLLAKPLAHMMQRHAQTAAFAPAKKHVAAPVRHVQVKTPAARLSRSHTGVLVLNGNGRAGAASSEASTLHALGYVVRGKGNAERQDYATTVVMYRKGFAGEGQRLARDLHVKIVGPLDGIARSELHGGQLVVVLGAD